MKDIIFGLDCHGCHNCKYDGSSATQTGPGDKKSCWESLLLKGVSTVETATGRAINVSHTAISNAGTMTCGMRDGKESRPSKKKISICISPVRPSKRRTGQASNMILYLCKKYRRKRPVVHVMQRFTPQHLNIKPDKKSPLQCMQRRL